MSCRMSQLCFSLAWMCFVSMGLSSTTTTIVCAITFRNVTFLVHFFQQDILLWKFYRATVNRDNTRWRVMPSRLDTWGLHSGAQKKGTPSFESSIFHVHDEKSEHEHGHTSANEDDLLKLLNLPECTQTWTRFDKRAKTYCTTSSSGPLWENVVARITIDDETGHIMSLEYTKHMTEKDLHRNLPSFRDIRTVLPHFSPVTPNKQLKQSF